MKLIDYKSPEIPKEIEELINRDKKVMFGAHTHTREIPLGVAYARGCKVYDLTGKEYLDLCAGWASCSTGHCHPDVVSCIKDQVEKLIHIGGSDFYYYPQVELAEKLVSIAPGDFPKRVYLANSGAETLEASLKVTKYYTKRHKVISFFGAFHGRTFAGMTLSGSKKVQRAGFGPLIPEVIHTLYPYCYRCPLDKKYPDCRDEKDTRFGVPMLPCVKFLVDMIFERLCDPYEVAAIVFEPIQGEGGYIEPPPEFPKLLRRIANEYGILLVADEIQCGLGRTGKWWALDHVGVAPDVLCTAKGIASGLPMGAVVAREEIMDKEVDPRAWGAVSYTHLTLPTKA